MSKRDLKVNLIYGDGDILNTHLNINPFSTDPSEIGDITNLDGLVEDSEATEILALDVVNYLPVTELQKTMEHWVTKLRAGGVIAIGGVDIFEVCKSFAQYRIDLQKTTELLYGKQYKPYLVRKNGLTLMGIESFLAGHMKLKILTKRVNNYQMVVEAQKI